MKIGIMKEVEVEAKELQIYMKVTDRFSAEIVDQDGKSIGGQEDGYVPSLMPGQHFGDYVILNINLDTGKVTNWKKPTVEQIQEFINQGG